MHLPLGLQENRKSLKKKLHSSRYCYLKPLIFKKALFFPAWNVHLIGDVMFLLFRRLVFCSWFHSIAEQL